MDNKQKPYAGFNQPDEAYGGADPVEIELAYLIQSGQIGKLRLLSILVERYAGEIRQLAGVMLSDARGGEPRSDVVDEVALRAFATAMERVDQFHGQASVRNWLLGITFQQGREYRRAIKRQNWLDKVFRRRKNEVGSGLPGGQENASIWQRILTLDATQRLCLFLRYGWELEITDIADIFGFTEDKIHALLADGRQRLSVKGTIAHFSKQIQASMDGLLGQAVENENQVSAHIEACSDCQAYLHDLKELENSLRQELKTRWPPLTITAPEMEKLSQGVIGQLDRYTGLKLSSFPLRRIAWVGGLGVFLLLALGLLVIYNPKEVQPRPVPTATQVLISKPIDFSGAEVISSSMTTNGEYYLPLIGSLSADGQVFAFGSITLSQNKLGLSEFQKIILISQQGQTVRNISSNQGIMYEGANIWELIHNFSLADDWLVYSAVGNPEEAGSVACLTEQGNGCKDIYALNLTTGISETITVSFDGSPADADSVAPVTSADGRWIAFWSRASNLVDNLQVTCGEGDSHCLNIYIYDRQSKKMTRLPVGRSNNFEDNFSIDRLSISADGRYVAFSLLSSDNLVTRVGMTASQEAYIYDQVEGKYIPVDINVHGEPGDDSSLSPVLSADGRFVAFASRSSNLVEGDTNGVFDVFVRDLQSGVVERVSVKSDGSQTDKSSGVFYGETGYSSLDLSEDGRYVVFLSDAVDLGTEKTETCESDNGNLCKSIFLHDRQTGQTELIRGNSTNHTFMYPQVSYDGSWVIFTEADINYLPYQRPCSDVMRYDRQRNWISNLTYPYFHAASSPWTMTTMLSDPKQQPLSINAIAFSPDGKFVAAGGDITNDWVPFLQLGDDQGLTTSKHFSAVEVWDVQQGQDTFTLDSSGQASILSLVYSQDGELLAAGTADGIVNVWRFSEKKRIFALDGHGGGRIHSLFFIPGSQDILAATNKNVYLWRRGEANYTLSATLDYPAGFVNSVALSPAGNLLAVAASDNTVWLQLLPSGTLLQRLGGSKTVISDLAFSPDGILLASRSIDGKLQLWHIDWQGFGALEAEPFKSLAEPGWFGELKFSPDGRYLASGSFSGGYFLWRIEDNRFFTLSPPGQYAELDPVLAFSQESSRLAMAGGSAINLWQSTQRVQAPYFFKYLDTDQAYQTPEDLLPPVDDWLSLANLVVEDSHDTLYQMDRRLGFGLRAPTSLPPDMIFKDVQRSMDGGVVLRYLTGPINPEETGATLLIYERPTAAGRLLMPLGASAAVEQATVDNLPLEYVPGDWVMNSQVPYSETQVIGWLWDNSLPVQRLRWSSGQVTYMLYYQASMPIEDHSSQDSVPSLTPYNVDSGALDNSLTKEDLLQIVGSMQGLRPSASSPAMIYTYTVVAGDTCTQIAARYGASIEAITQLNKMASCDLIYAGQKLKVPLSAERYTIAEADMDCDGSPERVQVVPAGSEQITLRSYGVGVEKLDSMGLYYTAWEYTIIDESASILTWPVIFKLSGCQEYLAFGVIGGDQSGLRVYLWDDQEMSVVYQDTNMPQAFLNPQEDGNTTSVDFSMVDPITQECQEVRVFITFDGAQSFSYTQAVKPGTGCREP